MNLHDCVEELLSPRNGTGSSAVLAARSIRFRELPGEVSPNHFVCLGYTVVMPKTAGVKRAVSLLERLTRVRHFEGQGSTAVISGEFRHPSTFCDVDELTQIAEYHFDFLENGCGLSAVRGVKITLEISWDSFPEWDLTL